MDAGYPGVLCSSVSTESAASLCAAVVHSSNLSFGPRDHREVDDNARHSSVSWEVSREHPDELSGAVASSPACRPSVPKW